MMRKPHYYELLGIEADSDAQTIRQAINSEIRKLQVQMNNPDKQSRDKAGKEMTTILEVRKILLNPARRKEYGVRI